ncbi:unnamed protein product [Strongylus vulgaris]|uniref:Uncharacterized protein n=1 Tax=Strongylus vulgaris TaxID=40348 RepID=A0A3P7IGR4_STRVU|nr:unnamed protein product [Strongylus vulgaris]
MDDGDGASPIRPAIAASCGDDLEGGADSSPSMY